MVQITESGCHGGRYKTGGALGRRDRTSGYGEEAYQAQQSNRCESSTARYHNNLNVPHVSKSAARVLGFIDKPNSENVQ